MASKHLEIPKDKWPAIIKAFRADFDLTQPALTVLLFLKPNSPAVSHWEAGYRTPNGYLWLALAGLSAILRRQKRLVVAKETWCEVAQPAQKLDA